jgi:hypothetical protein
MLPGMVPEPSPCKEFLVALTSASSTHSPVPQQLTEFYDEAKQLSNKFEDNEPVLYPYEGLVSVFHPEVKSASADLTKCRVSNSNDPVDIDHAFVCPLGPEMRRHQGDQSFVQDGVNGFRKNWDVFTQQTLSNLNWYVLLQCLVNKLGQMFLLLEVQFRHVCNHHLFLVVTTFEVPPLLRNTPVEICSL